MKTKNVIAALKKHKGPVYIAMSTVNDVMHIQCVKSDLIAQLSDNDPESVLTSASVSGGAMYIDAFGVSEDDYED